MCLFSTGTWQDSPCDTQEADFQTLKALFRMRHELTNQRTSKCHPERNTARSSNLSPKKAINLGHPRYCENKTPTEREGVVSRHR